MLTLRPVTAGDVDLLFRWANDPLVRNNAYSSELIDYSTHKQWFTNKLKASSCSIFILTDGNTNFGQVRGDIRGNHTEIDYSIDDSFRGRGLAKKMLVLFEQEAVTDFLYAEVKKNNTASQRVFEKLGYKKSEREDIYIYKKRIAHTE